MTKQEFISDLLLMLTAAIWGFAFVAQRVGAVYLGAFTYNGIRFALGCLSLLPLMICFNRKPQGEGGAKMRASLFPGGIIIGCVLFIAASLQQIGMATTEAGKAAFITGLYMVLVPLFGITVKHRVSAYSWLGVVLAVIGLYFLSITGKLSIGRGDLLILVAAGFWAVHILLIDHFSKIADALALSFVQFAVCSLLSLVAALVFEDITAMAIRQAAVPLLYGGICSVGVAYTLQVVGQRHAHPSHAAIIMSLETVFGALGGMLLLGESMTARGYLGCSLMFAGMMVSQFKGKLPEAKESYDSDATC